MLSETAPAAGRAALRHVIQTIVVPTDLSSVANHAFRFALEFARRADARVVLATVLEDMEGDLLNPIRLSPEASVRKDSPTEMVHRRLEELVASHKETGVPVEIVVTKGKPVSAIVRLAESHNADLIIMGTHARTGFRHFVLGSSAESLVREAPCSVLTLRGDEERLPDEIARILVPVDLSGYSIGLLEFSMMLAREYAAAVDVLHVVEPIPMLDAFSGAVTMNDVVPDLRRRAAAELPRLMEQIENEGVEVDLHIEEGHPASKILDMAEDRASDLIVIATRGISAVERFFIGSVAERVVRQAPCPVLAARLSVDRE